jgi:hypothetical protein
MIVAVQTTSLHQPTTLATAIRIFDYRVLILPLAGQALLPLVFVANWGLPRLARVKVAEIKSYYLTRKRPACFRAPSIVAGLVCSFGHLFCSGGITRCRQPSLLNMILVLFSFNHLIGVSYLQPSTKSF